MQPEDEEAAAPTDVAAYVASMSLQLAEVCQMAGMNEAARHLEDAAEATRASHSSSDQARTAKPPG